MQHICHSDRQYANSMLICITSKTIRNFKVQFKLVLEGLHVSTANYYKSVTNKNLTYSHQLFVFVHKKLINISFNYGTSLHANLYRVCIAPNTDYDQWTVTTMYMYV